MRQIVLAAVLIAVPVAIFFGVLRMQAPPPPPGLGDMSAFASIVTDVQAMTAKGDLPAAATRITDLESAWDDAEATLRPINAGQWGAVDDAIDASLKALRITVPQAAAVTTALANLQTVLADPSAATVETAAAFVEGIPITDATGHALPCEDMIAAVRQKLGATENAQVTDLQTKATERCNADDDQRANTFSAKALALLAK